MGVAKILQSLGLKKQAADIGSTGVDVVPGEQGQLIEQKDQLEQQKQELEQQIAQVDQKMATAPMTPQPPKEESTMDPIATPAPAAAPEKPVLPTPAAAAPAAAPAPIAPAAAVETGKEHEKKETKEEEKKEEAKKEAAFSIRFAQGKTFTDSYFVAEEKGEFRAARASRIIPVPVQEKILKCLAATGKPPEDVITPTEIIDQMTSQGVNSLESFEGAVTALEANASILSRKAGMFAWNESEVEKPAKVKAGEMPMMSMDMKEFKDGQKMHPAPSGTSSKTKQYFGRLPGAAGGEPTVAINPQSSANVKDKLDFMRRALEEMKQQKDEAVAKADSAEKKVGEMEKGNEDKESAGLMESIVKDLIAKKLASEKDEQGLVAALAKIDRKNLAAVASLLKLLGKSEGSAMGGGLPGAKPAVGMEPKPAPFGGAKPAAPFGAEQHPKASMSVLPPTFLNENEPEVGNGSAFLAKYWDAK
jgi:hypothetical protein